MISSPFPGEDESRSKLLPSCTVQDLEQGYGSGVACRKATWGTFFKANYVPCVIAATDVCFGLASGMSVRFFPIFFMTFCGLGPVMVSMIYTVAPVTTSLSSVLAQRISRRIGRVQATITFKVSHILAQIWS
jgi:hypothetical protein